MDGWKHLSESKKWVRLSLRFPEVEYSLILGYFPGLRLKAESAWFLTQVIGFHPTHPMGSECTMVKLLELWGWEGSWGGWQGVWAFPPAWIPFTSLPEAFCFDLFLHSKSRKGKFLFVPEGCRTCGRLKVLVKGTCWFQCSARKDLRGAGTQSLAAFLVLDPSSLQTDQLQASLHALGTAPAKLTQV